MFERFYRGRAARLDPSGGIGLGLALSQAIISAHGGRIEAQNAPEGGATFVMLMALTE